MTKEEIAQLYYEYYQKQLQSRDGCGGPVLVAILLLIFLIA